MIFALTAGAGELLAPASSDLSSADIATALAGDRSDWVEIERLHAGAAGLGSGMVSHPQSGTPRVVGPQRCLDLIRTDGRDKRPLLELGTGGQIASILVYTAGGVTLDRYRQGALLDQWQVPPALVELLRSEACEGGACICPPGTEDRGVCEPIDLCATGVCSHGTCTNTHGSFTCDCPPGTTYDAGAEDCLACSEDFYADCDGDGLPRTSAVIACDEASATSPCVDGHAPDGGWSPGAGSDCNDEDAVATLVRDWFPDCDGDGAYGAPTLSCSELASPCVDGEAPDGGWSFVGNPEDCNDEGSCDTGDTGDTDPSAITAAEASLDMAAWANEAYGAVVVKPNTGKVRFRPATWELETIEILEVLESQGCRLDTALQSYGAGAYNVTAHTFMGTSLEGPITGTLGQGLYEGTLGDGSSFGSVFSLYGGTKHASERTPGDFFVGRYVRKKGKRGVFSVLHGHCDGGATAPEALEDWFGGDLSGWP